MSAAVTITLPAPAVPAVKHVSAAMRAARTPTLDPAFLLAAVGAPSASSARILAPLCDLFLTEMEGRIHSLRNALDQQETCAPGDEIDFLLHAFRGSASHFGALRLVEIAALAESLAARQWADIALVTNDLEDELRRVRSALSDLVTQLSARVA